MHRIGDDDQGVHRPSGRYTARLVATVDGEVVFAAERDLLMCLTGSHPVGGAWMSFREAVPGAGTGVDLVWDPPAKTATPPRAAAPPWADEPPVVPPAIWRLVPPFPNPFN
jgi:hypothetical protein